MSACAPAASAPPRLTGDERPRTNELSQIPQPDLATIDLGSDGPGFDGSGDFYSYDSDLSPEATIGAYAGQLLTAGYRDAGSLGSWRVFIGPVLTVWVRTGTGGPPTSLLVRVEPTSAADASDPQSSTAAADPAERTPGPVVSGATRQPSSETSRRPDPPHASTSATATGSGGSATGGTASGGSGGTTTGTISGGTATSGGGTTTGSSGTSTGTSDGNGLTSR